MSYVEKNLIAGERVLYITGLHGIVLVWPIVLGTFFGLPGIILLIASIAGKSSDKGVTVTVGLALILIAAVSVLAGVISKKATEMAVTNRRVLVKVGFLNRKSYEILLPKIESIGIEEGVLGRILGYGSVVVRGTGGTPEPFRNIKNPSEFRRQVQGQIDASQPNTA
jgi:uncharacterized membrane protein YdbT with pleckstrin-like domain